MALKGATEKPADIQTADTVAATGNGVKAAGAVGGVVLGAAGQPVAGEMLTEGTKHASTATTLGTGTYKASQQDEGQGAAYASVLGNAAVIGVGEYQSGPSAFSEAGKQQALTDASKAQTAGAERTIARADRQAKKGNSEKAGELYEKAAAKDSKARGYKADLEERTGSAKA